MLAPIARQIRIALILRFAEIWQNVLVAPAGIALRSPLIEIASITTYVEHRVEHRRTAQHFAACPAAALVLHGLACVWLRLGSAL